jgi:hypothetical protein
VCIEVEVKRSDIPWGVVILVVMRFLPLFGLRELFKEYAP